MKVLLPLLALGALMESFTAHPASLATEAAAGAGATPWVAAAGGKDLIGSIPVAAETPSPPDAGSTPGSPSLPASLPPDARPPGEREPLLGLMAILSIAIAAGAGWYVYRVIRKGL